MSDPEGKSRPPEFARALGAIPSGVFIVTAGRIGAGGDAEATAMLATFVQQVGFEPPVLMVGVKKGRPIYELMREGGFCVSVLDEHSKHNMRHFARGFEPGQPAFDGIEVGRTDRGLPFLTDALAHLECRFVGEADWSDHLAVAGEVIGGTRRAEGVPLFHARKTGFSY